MRHYEQAIDIANKIRFRPEIAVTRLQTAELCLEEVQDVEDDHLRRTVPPQGGAISTPIG